MNEKVLKDANTDTRAPEKLNDVKSIIKSLLKLNKKEMEDKSLKIHLVELFLKNNKRSIPFSTLF